MGTVHLAAAILIIFNILDSVTTHIALYKLPEHLKAKESNPLMAKLFTKNYFVAQVIKHAFMLGIATYFIISKDLYWLELMAVMVGLVVVNNVYILAGIKLTGKKIDSPIRRLQRLFHVPDRLYYVFVAIIIFALSILIIENI